MRMMRGMRVQGDDPGGSIPHSHISKCLISILGLWDHYVTVTFCAMVTFSTMGIRYRSSLTPSPWLFLFTSPIPGTLVTLGQTFVPSEGSACPS